MTSRVWACSNLGIKTSTIAPTPIEEWIKNFKLFWKEDGIKSERATDFIATLWAIWLHKNNVVFRNLNENPVSILIHKDALLKELGEAAKTGEKQLQLTHNEIKVHLEVEFGMDNSQCENCIISVDRA